MPLLTSRGVRCFAAQSSKATDELIVYARGSKVRRLLRLQCLYSQSATCMHITSAVHYAVEGVWFRSVTCVALICGESYVQDNTDEVRDVLRQAIGTDQPKGPHAGRWLLKRVMCSQLGPA